MNSPSTFFGKITIHGKLVTCTYILKLLKRGHGRPSTCQPANLLRYVGVRIWRSGASSTYIDLHNKTHVALANLRSNIYKNRIQKRPSANLVIMAIISARMSIFELPIVFTIECRLVIDIWRCRPMICFKHDVTVFTMLYDTLWSSPEHIPFYKNVGILSMKKTSEPVETHLPQNKTHPLIRNCLAGELA
jgi:hypothetical protein